MNDRNHWLIAAACMLVPAVLAFSWVSSAKRRLAEVTVEKTSEVAVASATDAGYCNPALKKILRRVLQSCGLLSASGGAQRGCQPLEAKNVATVGGEDFNALFRPMRERGGIIQFDAAKADLDADDKALIESVFTNQQGASYFFVVSRASSDGTVEYNRELSKQRAAAVMGHLQSAFQDPDLEKEVGLMWLGEEFAQLDTEFCSWHRSGAAGACNGADINRGAFVSWIDCRL